MKISLTKQQLKVILMALEFEAVDDPAEGEEYSFQDCYNDIMKQVKETK